MINKKDIKKDTKIRGPRLNELDEFDEVSKDTDSKFRRNIVIVGVVVALLVSLIGVFVFSQTADKTITENAKQKAIQKEVAVIADEISKLLILPKKELPVMATISNVKELQKKQSFYKNAENGDKLLIYTKSKRAIIYSPSRNIIVNVGPVVLDNKK